MDEDDERDDWDDWMMTYKNTSGEFSLIESNCKSLYISDYNAASNHQKIGGLNIQAVVSILSKNTKPIKYTNITAHLSITMDDYEKEQISKYFNCVSEFISIHSNESILIHCMAGISRSVTLVIAYLMIKEKKSMFDAYKIVQQGRSGANPNPGFREQLCKLSDDLKNIEGNMGI